VKSALDDDVVSRRRTRASFDDDGYLTWTALYATITAVG